MSKFIDDFMKLGSTKLALISVGIFSLPPAIQAVKEIVNSDEITRKKVGKAFIYSGCGLVIGTLAYKGATTLYGIVKHHYFTKDDGNLHTIKRAADAMYEKAKASNRKGNGDSDDDDEDQADKDDLDSDTHNLSDIPPIDGHYDDHQLTGKLLYREDICLCYGEEHIAKTSIILNWIIDIVLQRKARLMPDDKGTHPPYHCIWYNGEMNQADLHVFFGNYNRRLLDGKIDFVENFAHLNLFGWLKNVELRLQQCSEDTVVVLDNLSCISNSTGAEVKNMKNVFLSLQRKIFSGQGIRVTFIVIDHINKKGDVAGSYKLKALFSNRMRFSAYKEAHTKITVEKSRAYHELHGKSFDYEWTIAPEGYKSFENKGEIKMGDREPPKKGADNKEPMFDSYTLSQVQELYELSQKQKPNPKGEGTVPYSSRDIAEAASFKISHAKVCDLIRQYKDYMAKNSTPEAESDDYVEYDEVE